MTTRKSIHELEKHFRNSGFVDSLELMASLGVSVMDGMLVMHNNYGLMVALKVSGVGAELSTNLSRVKEEMHFWFREVLLRLEKPKGLIIDGYLLLVLEQEPDKQVKESVNEIELDTRVCRKHVLWPRSIGDDGLDRLQFVTVLALPDTISNNLSEKTRFELSKKAEILIAEYEKKGSLERLLGSIKEGVLKDVN